MPRNQARPCQIKKSKNFFFNVRETYCKSDFFLLFWDVVLFSAKQKRYPPKKLFFKKNFFSIMKQFVCAASATMGQVEALKHTSIRKRKKLCKMPGRALTVPASGAATLVGIDPFDNICRACIGYVRQLKPDLHKQWEKRAQEGLANDTPAHWLHGAEKIRRLDQMCGTNLAQCIQQTATANLESQQKTLLETIAGQTQLTAAQKAAAVAAVTEVTNCQHGIRHERNVMAAVQADANEALPHIAQQIRLKKHWLLDTPAGEHPVFVTGTCDGLTADGQTLVEVKSRQKGLFRRLRDYEAVQVLLYMHMAGVKQAVLVEEHRAQRRAYRLCYDQGMAETILDRLAATMTFITAAIEDEDEHILQQWYEHTFHVDTLHPTPLDVVAAVLVPPPLPSPLPPAAEQLATISTDLVDAGTLETGGAVTTTTAATPCSDAISVSVITELPDISATMTPQQSE